MTDINNNSGVAKLAKYGLAGVCIALVLLVGFVINQFFGVVGNHIQHNTESWNKNTEALTELKGVIENSNNIMGSVENALEELDKTIQINFKK